MIKFFVNARFLTQPVSGVQRYGIECSTQIRYIYPGAVFLSPYNIIDEEMGTVLRVQVIGSQTGQAWEQYELPQYLKKNGNHPLLNLANTGPLFYNNNFITIHDLAFYHHPEWNSRLFSRWYNFLLPRLAKRARHIFTVSNTIQQEIARYYKVSKENISVTGNGLSLRIQSKNRDECNSKEKIILSVGSFNARKNHHQLIKGFLASGLQDTYQLVIMGDKYKVFRETGLNEQSIQHSSIKIVQGITDKQLIELYCKAEVIASLSLYEGFGIPVLEGLYFGCKAVCSDILVYREVYGKYAFFCDPGNIGSIAGALKTAAAANTISRQDIMELTSQYNYKRSAEIILQQIQDHSA